MRRRFFSLVAAAAMSFAAAAPGGAFEFDPSSAFAGRVIAIVEPVPAPESVIDLANGETATLDDWSGKVRLVTLWATWCHVCEIEMPIMARMVDDYSEDDLVILPVSVDEAPAEAKVAKHLNSHGLDVFPVMLDRHHGMAGRVGLRGTPTTLIVDKFDQVVGAFEGQAPWNDKATRAWLQALIDAEDAESSRLLLAY